jgi:hypothetical protein
MKRSRVAALVSAVMFAAASAGPASSQTSSTGRIPTVSRLVLLFSEQETRLAERIAARDQAAVGQMLTEDFELRAGSQPGRPIPRADWMRQSLQSPGPVVAPREMAVHDLGNAAIVSFLQRADGNANLFVVDVWRRAGEEWKLAIRYAAPAGPGNVAIPGVPPEKSEFPKRY